MKVKSESEVTQLCLTLRDPMGLPPSMIFQARVLEWGAIAFSKYFGYLRLKAIPLEKILMLGKTEGRRQRAIEDEIVGWHY